jgi:hypothetical protein
VQEYLGSRNSSVLCEFLVDGDNIEVGLLWEDDSDHIKIGGIGHRDVSDMLVTC